MKTVDVLLTVKISEEFYAELLDELEKNGSISLWYEHNDPKDLKGTTCLGELKAQKTDKP